MSLERCWFCTFLQRRTIFTCSWSCNMALYATSSLVRGRGGREARDKISHPESARSTSAFDATAQLGIWLRFLKDTAYRETARYSTIEMRSRDSGILGFFEIWEVLQLHMPGLRSTHTGMQEPETYDNGLCVMKWVLDWSQITSFAKPNITLSFFSAQILLLSFGIFLSSKASKSFFLW